MFWNRIIDRKSLGNRLFGSVFYKFVSGTVGYAVAHKPYSLEAIQAKTLRKTRDNESRDNELSQENELGFLEKLSLMMTKKLNEQVNNYSQQGKYQQAIPFAGRALVIREKLLGDEHPLVAKSLNTMAELYRQMGESVRAEPLYRRALDIRKKTLEDEGLHYSFLDNLERAFQTRSSGQFFVMERPLRA